MPSRVDILRVLAAMSLQQLVGEVIDIEVVDDDPLLLPVLHPRRGWVLLDGERLSLLVPLEAADQPAVDRAEVPVLEAVPEEEQRARGHERLHDRRDADPL